MHHPVKALAQLPQQRQPGGVAIGFSVANVRAPAVARVATLLIAEDANNSRARGYPASRLERCKDRFYSRQNANERRLGVTQLANRNIKRCCDSALSQRL